MRFLFALPFFFLPLFGQAGNPGLWFPGLPPGGLGSGCTNSFIGYITAAGGLVTCLGGDWTIVAPGSGGVSITFLPPLTGGTIVSSGSVGLDSVQTTFDVPNGGFYNNGAGYIYGSWDFGTSFSGGIDTGGRPGFVLWQMAPTGAPAATTQFRFPPNWDATKPMDLLVTLSDASAAGGSYRLTGALYCQAPNTAFSVVFDPASSSGSVSFVGFGRSSEATLPALSTSGCAPGSLALLQITRDNSISGNSSGNLGILQVSVQLYRF